MRLNGLGAGTSVFSARYVGLRHDPRNRRPRQPRSGVSGDSPLVILDVVTTCGCTVPDFSKKPILPGEKTQITVTYDPANRPGSFTKELWVYSSEKRKIATLTRAGSVIPAENRRGLYTSMPAEGCGWPRRSTPSLYLSGAAGAGGDRLREHLETPGPPRTAARNHERALRTNYPGNRSRRANGVKSTSPTSSPPTNPATGPCATRWRS